MTQRNPPYLRNADPVSSCGETNVSVWLDKATYIKQQARFLLKRSGIGKRFSNRHTTLWESALFHRWSCGRALRITVEAQTHSRFPIEAGRILLKQGKNIVLIRTPFWKDILPLKPGSFERESWKYNRFFGSGIQQKTPRSFQQDCSKWVRLRETRFSRSDFFKHMPNKAGCVLHDHSKMK